MGRADVFICYLFHYRKTRKIYFLNVQELNFSADDLIFSLSCYQFKQHFDNQLLVFYACNDVGKYNICQKERKIYRWSGFLNNATCTVGKYILPSTAHTSYPIGVVLLIKYCIWPVPEFIDKFGSWNSKADEFTCLYGSSS